ncbi:MAG: NTP transferase domain-containing protein, partial [Candidatus Brockarchaeota archaeon]|nr:NTP transferase domain-containing protein [Candidatus Brockarchaeota archaeon]
MTLPVVIIAAGVASRLKPYSDETPKCLMELEPGVTILDFILSRLENINPPRVFIVTRPRFRGVLEGKLKGKVDLVETDREEFGNLYSVSLALKRLGADSFLILMSDHIYEKAVVEDVLSSGSKAAFTVCLDRKPSRTEAEEGLKIVLKEQGVAYADKKALPRHGIDTGVILCGEKSKKYIEKAIEEFGPNATIADALKLASADNEVDYADVTGKLWKDIDTPEDLVKGRGVYWQILRKENEAEGGLISRFLIKPVSTRISIAIYRGFNVEPLVITLVSLIFALSASFLLAIGSLLWGGLLVGFVSLISEVGNELVNLCDRKKSWRFHVSSLLDRAADIAIVVGFSMSLLPVENNIIFLFTILAASNMILVSYATQGLNSLSAKTRVLRNVPATRDVLLFVVFVSSMISLPLYGLYYLSIAPIFYLFCSIILTLISEKGKSERIRKLPKPEVVIDRGEVGRKIESLVSNSLKLALTLLFLHMATPVVADITLITFDDLVLKSDHLLSALFLVASIYFGYRILMA